MSDDRTPDTPAEDLPDPEETELIAYLDGELDPAAARRVEDRLDDDLKRFIDTLRRAGVSVKVRKRKGSEIDAACGQLRRKVESEQNHRGTETQSGENQIRV